MAKMRAGFLRSTYFVEYAVSIENRPDRLCVADVPCQTLDFSKVREFPIPVVMFIGRHGYATLSESTAAWLAHVTAPHKQGVWFENSSHLIPWEESGKTLASLLEFARPLAVDR